MFPSQFEYLEIDLENSSFSQLLPLLTKSNEWIQKAIQKGNVLVHCLGGISRAPAIVIGYLMTVHSMSFDQAFSTVQHNRFCINPIDSFVTQLKALETIIQAGRDTNEEISQTGRGGRKRDEMKDARDVGDNKKR